MRIRFPFLAAFFILLFLSAYAGLLPHSEALTPYRPNDKVLHVVTFFCLTLVFYFILDTSRRRVVNITLVVCTFILGVGSEVLQGYLPNGRIFDPYDILANVVGSLGATGIASWYHRRMLERRRKAKYSVLGQGEEGLEGDLELGEGLTARVTEGEQEGRITISPSRSQTLEEEVDNWDENAADEAWDDDVGAITGKSDSTGKPTPPSSTGDEQDVKLAKD
ncbi:hypothetical protein UCRPC4_g02139 [Phaeomoniella chlamydospora]|uniref:VanZ-like domain-containing protein n=1 Tax=Phaeomoniella chlamydospora TaxID=158046 RepID=A0A0G2EQL8_PHACM|nr:hypothetical protein UCRPC4_g02139 [Phaeomoniella chlamydospora]